MIRVERDPAFWTAVAGHPQVAPTLGGVDPAAIGALARHAAFVPLAAAHGGFLLQRRDELGFCWELHTLFTPEGWGREAVRAALAALELMFGSRASLITTLEVRANPRSRPWTRLGFAPAGAWTATEAGELRPWILTKTAWLDRRAIQRRGPCPL